MTSKEAKREAEITESRQRAAARQMREGAERGVQAKIASGPPVGTITPSTVTVTVQGVEMTADVYTAEYDGEGRGFPEEPEARAWVSEQRKSWLAKRDAEGKLVTARSRLVSLQAALASYCDDYDGIVPDDELDRVRRAKVLLVGVAS